MRTTEIDLRKNPHLRLLQVDLDLEDEDIISWSDETQWLDSLCECVASRSLVIEVRGFSKETELCNKIQDSLLALNERIDTLSVYLFNTNILAKEVMKMSDIRELFSRLYEMDIVIEKFLSDDESVCHFFSHPCYHIEHIYD